MTKNISKTKAIKIFLPAIIALSVFYMSVISVNAKDYSYYPPIVQKIADKFDIEVSEVQDVFDEERDERRAEKYARFADRLDDLVADNVITIEQKDLILDKHEDLQNEIETLDNLSASERNEKIKDLHQKYLNFLQQQGIDFHVFGPRSGFSRKGFFDYRQEW